MSLHTTNISDPTGSDLPISKDGRRKAAQQSSDTSTTTTTTSTQRKFNSISLSSVQKYEHEWHDLSDICEDPKLLRLRQVSIDGHLKVSKFRSVCWAILLDVLNGNARSWVKQRRKDRVRYDEIKCEHSANPHDIQRIAEDDPLSQSNQSVWNQHFCDKELRGIIKQDVVRTFPGVDFYRKPAIQELMIDVLFCYAREHPEMCYRQGMHEILAPILFVMHCDHQTLLHIQDIATVPIENSLKEVLDPKYMEEDSYFVFAKVMVSIESFYRTNDTVPSATGYFPVSAAASAVKSCPKLEMYSQLNHIRDKILAKVDLPLHNHLQQLDIPLSIFGIRWLRLLFGREFPLQDLLVLWDAIFAEGRHLELIKFIVVAMLVRIRQKLLNSDYTTCLTYLMKYPANVDITLIIRHAMHFKAPQSIECPPGAFSSPQPMASLTTPKTTGPSRSATLPRQMSSTMRQARGSLDLGRPHTHSHDENRSKLSALVADEQLQIRINNIQNTTALAAMRFAGNSQAMGEHDPGIVDGFLEDSPEALRCQLENAYTIMSITRLKLTKYLTVLRKHIPGNSVHEIHQSMDGIEELCSLLRIKANVPYATPAPVERAFEVSEPVTDRAAPQRNHNNHKPKVMSTPVRPTVRKVCRSEQQSKKDFVEALQRSDNEFEIVVNDDGVVDTLTHNIRTRSSPDSSDSDNNSRRSCVGVAGQHRSRYEIPDDHLMSRKATKILGDRKEVELHEFRHALSSSSSSEHAGSGGGASRRINSRDLLNIPAADPSGERDSPTID